MVFLTYVAAAGVAKPKMTSIDQTLIEEPASE
jgi:hypothetical protein